MGSGLVEAAVTEREYCLFRSVLYSIIKDFSLSVLLLTLIDIAVLHDQ